MTAELESLDDSKDLKFTEKIESSPDTLTLNTELNEDAVLAARPPMRKKVKPLVSVIIPVYNCEKFIIKAVQSVLGQTYENIEILIINDGSTDNTEEVLLAKYRKYMEEKTNLRYYKKHNGGTASALNVGIRNAKGEYIKWLSADDVLYPHAITDLIMLGAEDYGARSQFAIFYTDYDIIDENDNIITEFREPARNFLNQEGIVNELFQHYFGNGSTTLIHKNVFHKCGLFNETDIKHSEDYEFLLRATALFNIAMIHVPIKSLKYRRHPGQLTNKIGGSLDEKIKEMIRRQIVQRR